MKFFRSSSATSQQGAVLVLALLVLSFIMFTALSLASVLVVELRSAKYLDSAIIAHYAAESGAEKALFHLKEAHSIDELQSNGAQPYDYFFGLQGTSDYVLHSQFGATDFDRSFKLTTISKSSKDFTAYNIPVNQSVQMDIFDPNQETSSSINTGATTLNVDWSTYNCPNNDRLEISILELRNSGTNGLEIVPGPQNPKREYPVCNCVSTLSCDTAQVTLNRSSFYRISIRPIDHDIQTAMVRLTNDDTGTPTAVEIPSQIFIQTQGKYRNATQTVTVQTPWNNGVSDLFNYVIFSEASLIKNVVSQNISSFQSRCGRCQANVGIGCSNEGDCSGLSPTSCTLNVNAYCSDSHGGTNAESSSGTFNQNNYGACNARCTGYTFCGDGIRQSSATGGLNGDNIDEVCDDGNSSDTDPCNASCQATRCGDGIVQGPQESSYGPNGNNVYEVCDEGDALNGSGPGHCNSTCTAVQSSGGNNGNGCRRNCAPPI